MGVYWDSGLIRWKDHAPALKSTIRCRTCIRLCVRSASNETKSPWSWVVVPGRIDSSTDRTRKTASLTPARFLMVPVDVEVKGASLVHRARLRLGERRLPQMQSTPPLQQESMR